MKPLAQRLCAFAARHEWLTVAVLGFLWLATFAGLRPLMRPDEARYVGVAWEMMRSGDWVTPTLNGLPYFHKPPLFYWLSAGAMSVLGVHEWAGRLPALIGGWGMVFASFCFARRWCGRRVATLVALALLLQPMVLVSAQFANLDMLVAGCVTATILLLAQAVWLREAGLPWRLSLAAAYAGAALGVLAKGLIGAALPALVIVLWLLLRRSPRALWRLLWWPGIALFLLVAGPWFVAMQLRFPEFFHYFIVVQHFQRFAETGFNNVAPFWFYPAVLVLAWLPFAPWLAGWRNVTDAPGAKPVAADIRLLMLTWLLAITAFFTMPASKLVGYILPVMPPAAWLLATALASWENAGARRPAWRMWIGPAVAGVAGLGLVFALALDGNHRNSRALGLELARLRAPGEPVVMVDDYVFGLPVYAGLPRPVPVVEAWSAAAAARRDTWRKELLDAGHFAPDLATSLLLPPEALEPLVCRAARSWVVGDESSPERHPFLRMASRVRAVDGHVLWRVEPGRADVATALHCPTAAGPEAVPGSRP